MVKEINDAQFESEVLNAENAIVGFFFKDGCPPCNALKPVFEQFAEANPNVKFYKMQFEKNGKKPDSILIDEYNLTSFPTVIGFEKGKVIKIAKGKDAMKEFAVKAPIEKPIPAHTLQDMSSTALNFLKADIETELEERRKTGKHCKHCSISCRQICNETCDKLKGDDCKSVCDDVCKNRE